MPRPPTDDPDRTRLTALLFRTTRSLTISMLTKTSLLRSYQLPVLANSGAAQTAWRTVAPTPHTATVHRRVPRDTTDNKHLRQSKTAEPYNKSTRPKVGDVAAFLCHFLGDHREPEKVLKKAGLEGADWEAPDSVHALSTASTKFLPRTLHSDRDADSDAVDSGDLSSLEASDSDDNQY
jgi:hypothetical protein